jgi:homoserine O-acetyltransferase
MYSIQLTNPFVLENGEIIENLSIGFHIYGTLTPQKDNVIWACHALTANSDVLDWWSGIFGTDKLFDPEKYFIVCVNALGSCYGTTGPSTHEENEDPLLDQFPDFTTRDIARVHNELRCILGIDKIKLLLGASLGGQQAMEWSILQPEVFEYLGLIATNAQHSAYGIAFNESQRLAIYADSTYGNGRLDGGRSGLIAARSIAMLSYRSYAGYVETQTNPGQHTTGEFLASHYQQYQGQKLANRFNAYSYVCLGKAMDSHNVGRNRVSVEAALAQIQAKTIVIGISSDGLFPTSEQHLLARNINNASYAEIDSKFGHDGFLIEAEQLTDLLADFLFNDFKNHKPTRFKSNIEIT